MIQRYDPATFAPVGDWSDVPIDVYHNPAFGLSSSMLGHLDPPARLPVYLNEKQERSAWSMIGSLVHSRILEPDKPLPSIIVTPETYPGKTGECQWTYQANYCKKWRNAHEAKGLIVLSQDEYDIVVGCVQSISARRLCREAFSKPGSFELSCFGEYRGVKVRIRPDFVPSTGNAIIDLKTTLDEGTNKSDWESTVIKRRYHVQSAFYLDVWNALHPDDQRGAFCWIVVEKAPPYLVGEFVASQRLIESGRYQYRLELEAYRQCLDSGQWPGHLDAWAEVAPPRWMA